MWGTVGHKNNQVFLYRLNKYQYLLYHPDSVSWTETCWGCKQVSTKSGNPDWLQNYDAQQALEDKMKRTVVGLELLLYAWYEIFPWNKMEVRRTNLMWQMATTGIANKQFREIWTAIGNGEKLNRGTLDVKWDRHHEKSLKDSLECGKLTSVRLIAMPKVGLAPRAKQKEQSSCKNPYFWIRNGYRSMWLV